MRGKRNIKGDIPDPKRDPGHPKITDPVKKGPLGIISPEGGLGFFFIQEVVHVDILGLHGHMPDIFKEMRRMGVLFRVAVRMVHTMQNGIGPGVQKRRTLGDKSQHIEELFPERMHFEHLVRAVAMQEKSLRK